EGDFGQLQDGVVGGDAGGYIHHRLSLSDDTADRLSAGGGNRSEVAIVGRRAPVRVQSCSGSISPLLIRSRRSVMTRPASETRDPPLSSGSDADCRATPSGFVLCGQSGNMARSPRRTFGSTAATIVLLKPPGVPYQISFGRCRPPSSSSLSSAEAIRCCRSSSAEATTPIAAADPKGMTTSTSESKAAEK